MKNSQIVEIFNYFKNNPKMHTEFYHDGCVHRTKEICDYILNNKDYDNERVLFAKILPDKGSEITCQVPCSQNLKSFSIKWSEHLVPIVYDEKGELLALDICLMDGPERLSDYVRHFSDAKIDKANICSARFPLDYAFFNMKLSNCPSLESVALDDDKMKMHPNTVSSHWLEDYKRDERRLNNNSYFLEVKDKLVQKRLREAGIVDNQGKTGDSITGHVSSGDRNVALIRQSVLKQAMLRHRGRDK